MGENTPTLDSEQVPDPAETARQAAELAREILVRTLESREISVPPNATRVTVSLTHDRRRQHPSGSGFYPGEDRLEIMTTDMKPSPADPDDSGPDRPGFIVVARRKGVGGENRGYVDDNGGFRTWAVGPRAWAGGSDTPASLLEALQAFEAMPEEPRVEVGFQLPVTNPEAVARMATPTEEAPSQLIDIEQIIGGYVPPADETSGDVLSHREFDDPKEISPADQATIKSIGDAISQHAREGSWSEQTENWEHSYRWTDPTTNQTVSVEINEYTPGKTQGGESEIPGRVWVELRYKYTSNDSSTNNKGLLVNVVEKDDGTLGLDVQALPSDKEMQFLRAEAARQELEMGSQTYYDRAITAHQSPEEAALALVTQAQAEELLTNVSVLAPPVPRHQQAPR